MRPDSAASATTVSTARPSGVPLHQTIKLAHTLEVLGWSQALGCSEAGLRLAVAEVGPELEDVCSHLGLPPAAGHRPAWLGHRQ